VESISCPVPGHQGADVHIRQRLKPAGLFLSVWTTNAVCTSCCRPTNAFLGLQVNVSLSLVGENASPVTASLSVFHRSGTNGSTALPAKLQQDEALYWDVGEYGSPKTVTVTLPQAVSCCAKRRSDE